MAPPSPPWMEAGSSPMIAPTMLAVAEILKAAKRYGSEAGTRSFQRTFHALAAYERMSSSARGSADCRPRSVLIVTGKNVRYAAIPATGNHGGSGSPPRPGSQPGHVLPPSHTTTIGAMARIGIV